MLIVVALSSRHVDLNAPTTDEFFSMFNAGWLVNGPYSPAEIILSIKHNSPAHTPGYFMLLSAWGNLTTFDVALGRMLTIFCAILALAISYRVVSDFVSPVAGLFATVILASNAFYNFYIPHARMYPLMLFLAGIALWLYLRILYQLKSPKRTDYAALLVAAYALVNTHVFSATFFITLGLYHLIFVRKNKIWWRVSFAVIVAMILFLPYIMVSGPVAIDRAITKWGRFSASGLQAASVWLTVFSNGQPLLLLLSLTGVALGTWKNLISLKSYYFLVVIYVFVLGLLAQASPLVFVNGMRHQLHSWFALALAVSLGLLGIYRFRRWLAILVLLWVVAGASFQKTADWDYFLSGRTHAFDEPPWHAISRVLAGLEMRGPVFGLRLPLDRIGPPKQIGYSQQEHYFDRANIDFRDIGEIATAEALVLNDAYLVPEFSLIYQKSYKKKREAKRLRETATSSQYAACETLEFSVDTVVERYRWQTLGCETRPASARSTNELIDYRFYAAQVDSTGSQVHFVDEWTGRGDDSLERYNMSYQLISKNWENVAQVDWPLVHEGMLRQFRINVDKVPKGSYKLMAVFYDKHTGERFPWPDSGADRPDMLPLAEVVLE